jgi:hypothetical protein
LAKTGVFTAFAIFYKKNTKAVILPVFMTQPRGAGKPILYVKSHTRTRFAPHSPARKGPKKGVSKKDGMMQ